MMMRPKPPSLFYLPQNPKQRDIQKRNKFGREGGTFGSVDDTFAKGGGEKTTWATRRVQQQQQKTTREMTGGNNDGLEVSSPSVLEGVVTDRDFSFVKQRGGPHAMA